MGSKWLSDEEIEELKKARPASDNPGIDFYWLGYDAGKMATKEKYEDSRGTWLEEYNRACAAEKERDALKAENALLKSKVKKLKKKLKGGF